MSPASQHPSRRRAFTVTEIVVVVAIVSVLATVMFPAYRRMKALGIGTAFGSS